jgi:hypothetical protein
MRSRLLILSVVIALSEGVRAQGMPAAEIIADQIRDQGFSCNEALTAQRDPAYSRPAEQVAGASVYQLGTFGTARKELKALTLAP